MAYWIRKGRIERRLRSKRVVHKELTATFQARGTVSDWLLISAVLVQCARGTAHLKSDVRVVVATLADVMGAGYVPIFVSRGRSTRAAAGAFLLPSWRTMATFMGNFAGARWPQQTNLNASGSFKASGGSVTAA
jgi:hypothetical protein